MIDAPVIGWLPAGCLGPPGRLAAPAYAALAREVEVAHPRRSGGPGLLLVVVSAVAREGRTSVAAGLAVALAAGGHSVVVAEADLRRPALCSFLALDPRGPGIEALLSGHCSLAAVLREIALPVPGRLFALPAAHGRVDPQALLGAGPCADTFGALARLVEYVIVDTPPLLAVADATALLARADGVLFVTREGAATPAQAAIAADELGAGRVSVVATAAGERVLPRHSPVVKRRHRMPAPTATIPRIERALSALQPPAPSPARRQRLRERFAAALAERPVPPPRG